MFGFGGKGFGSRASNSAGAYCLGRGCQTCVMVIHTCGFPKITNPLYGGSYNKASSTVGSITSDLLFLQTLI